MSLSAQVRKHPVYPTCTCSTNFWAEQRPCRLSTLWLHWLHICQTLRQIPLLFTDLYLKYITTCAWENVCQLLSAGAIWTIELLPWDDITYIHHLPYKWHQHTHTLQSPLSIYSHSTVSPTYKVIHTHTLFSLCGCVCQKKLKECVLRTWQNIEV